MAMICPIRLAVFTLVGLCYTQPVSSTNWCKIMARDLGLENVEEDDFLIGTFITDNTWTGLEVRIRDSFWGVTPNFEKQKQKDLYEKLNSAIRTGTVTNTARLTLYTAPGYLGKDRYATFQAGNNWHTSVQARLANSWGEIIRKPNFISPWVE